MKRSAIILIIMFMFLFASCSKNKTVTPTPDLSATAQVTNEPVETGLTPTAEPSPSESPSESPTQLPETTVTPAVTAGILRPENGQITIEQDGVEHVVNVKLAYQNLHDADPFLAFSIYQDVLTYTLWYVNEAYRFVVTEAEAEPTFLEIGFTAGKRADDIKPTFADTYIDYTDITFSSYCLVGHDSLTCTTINAENSALYLVAYLVDVEGGVLTLGICCDKNDLDAHYPLLAGMLGTFVLHK